MRSSDDTTVSLGMGLVLVGMLFREPIPFFVGLAMVLYVAARP